MEAESASPWSSESWTHVTPDTFQGWGRVHLCCTLPTVGLLGEMEHSVSTCAWLHPAKGNEMPLCAKGSDSYRLNSPFPCNHGFPNQCAPFPEPKQHCFLLESTQRHKEEWGSEWPSDAASDMLAILLLSLSSLCGRAEITCNAQFHPPLFLFILLFMRASVLYASMFVHPLRTWCLRRLEGNIRFPQS